MEKKCSKCGEVKSLDEFCNKKDCKDGKALRCKSCAKDYIKNLRENKPQNIGTLEFINLFEKNHGLKRCIKCEVLKSLDQFTSRKDSKDGKRNKCKFCVNEYNSKSYQKKVKKEYSKEYYLKNKDRLIKEISLYSKKKKENDSLYKLRCVISHRIRQSIKTKGYTKKTKTYNILKCEFDFFMHWINGVASNGYSYGVGNTHLDHVVPISLAQTEEEILLLNHYSNLQLLTADENLTKGNRYVNPTNLKRVLEHHPNPDKIREIYSRL